MNNLLRWLSASIFDHFQRDLSGLKVFAEGAPRDTNKDQEFVEIRIDGPQSIEVSKDVWDHFFVVNVLIQAVKTAEDIYKIHRIVDRVRAALRPTLPIFKYGPVPSVDTGELLGIIRIERADSIESTMLGQFKPDVNLLLASVETRYKLEEC